MSAGVNNPLTPANIREHHASVSNVNGCSGHSVCVSCLSESEDFLKQVAVAAVC